MSDLKRDQLPQGKHWIYRASMKLPAGRIIYARCYGKRAFRILVDD